MFRFWFLSILFKDVPFCIGGWSIGWHFRIHTYQVGRRKIGTTIYYSTLEERTFLNRYAKKPYGMWIRVLGEGENRDICFVLVFNAIKIKALLLRPSSKRLLGLRHRMNYRFLYRISTLRWSIRFRKGNETVRHVNSCFRGGRKSRHLLHSHDQCN